MRRQAGELNRSRMIAAGPVIAAGPAERQGLLRVPTSVNAGFSRTRATRRVSSVPDTGAAVLYPGGTMAVADLRPWERRRRPSTLGAP